MSVPLLDRETAGLCQHEKGRPPHSHAKRQPIRNIPQNLLNLQI
jgi:hypothetical protein